MSRAAILATGPSVSETWPATEPAAYDHVLAINEAVRLLPDSPGQSLWWVFGDVLSFDFLETPNPHLRLAMPSAVLRRLLSEPCSDRLPGFAAAYAIDRLFPQRPPLLFSLLMAIGLAVALGAREIDLHGVDWSGVRSYDGVEWAGRDADRWAVERGLSESLFRYLRRRFGVTVRRVPTAGVAYPSSPRWAVAFHPHDLESFGIRPRTADELEAARVRITTRSVGRAATDGDVRAAKC